VAILDDVTEWGAGFEFAMVVMQAKLGIIVDHADLEDWLGLGSDVRPDPNGIEDIA